MSSEREELAREIYATDNWRDPFAYDEWPKLSERQQEYAYAIADRLIVKGYRKVKQP
jgi:hypothetical protein